MRARAFRRPPLGVHGVLDFRLGSCRVLPGSKFPSPKIPGFQFLARILAKPGGVLTPPYPPGGPGHSAGHAGSWLLAALVPNFSDFYRIFRRSSRFFRHICSIDFSHVFFSSILGSIWARFWSHFRSYWHHFGITFSSFDFASIFV